MNYSYFGQQTNQNTSPIPNSSQNTLNQIPNSQISPFVAGQQYQNFATNQTLFPQPTGSVYNLNTASEIGNIPVGFGFSIGLCLNENVMYIKGIQNGNTMLLGYKLSPIEGNSSSNSVESNVQNEELKKENEHLIEVLKGHENKIQMIENQLIKMKDKIGGKGEWQF